MKLNRRIGSDAGNALLEAVGFVTVAFGLLLVAGLELFQLQQSQLELQTIARNAMRSYLIQPQSSIAELVKFNQQQSRAWQNEDVEMLLSCSAGCDLPGGFIVLSIVSGGLSAKAFGVIPG